jgi:putative ABC transport system permease protein
MKFVLLIFKNVRRNLLRSALTALGTMVLASVVILVWSMLAFLDAATQEKTQDFKAIVSERWQIPSLMPFAYASTLCEGAYRKEGDVKPQDACTWQFYVGTLDLKNRAREDIVFAVATQPEKVVTMFDEIDTLPPSREMDDLKAAAKRLKENRQGIIMGRERLAAINKKIGERFTIYSLNYKGIDLEFEILGVFPDGRWNNASAMNCEYLLSAIDEYNQKPGNPRHPMSDRNLSLVWLKVPDTEAFNRVGAQIMRPGAYADPPVKYETAASGMASFLAAFRDLIWGVRWLLAPAILITLSLVIANAISISVRERRTEFAVLKVLGFRPAHILLLVLGEALLIGVCAGLASAGLTYAVINWGFGGLKFQIAFFTSFLIPAKALGWGVGIGAVTALVGSAVPAWSARNVKVAEVFAKVA